MGSRRRTLTAGTPTAHRTFRRYEMFDIKNRVTPLQAHRRGCIQCTCGCPKKGVRGEPGYEPGYCPDKTIRECADKDCDHWPFRFGTDPWRKGKGGTGNPAWSGTKAG
jgi:hypothetical protein